MESELPKVLHSLLGKPLILHVIDNLKDSGINDLIVVVGYKGEMVIKAIGDSVEYCWQKEQLGTGHAVMQTKDILKNYSGSILVACGDVPLIQSASFAQLQDESNKEGIRAVVLTMIQQNPAGYGRIVTCNDNKIERIVEEKDATPKEKKIKEVNTGTYVFDKDLLFSGLKTIKTDNAQGEYYLPDVLDYIRSKGYSIGRVLLENCLEGSGINSKEDLARLEGFLQRK